MEIKLSCVTVTIGGQPLITRVPAGSTVSGKNN